MVWSDPKLPAGGYAVGGAVEQTGGVGSVVFQVQETGGVDEVLDAGVQGLGQS